MRYTDLLRLMATEDPYRMVCFARRHLSDYPPVPPGDVWGEIVRDLSHTWVSLTAGIPMVVRNFRALRADLDGNHVLAEVIRTDEGRQIVRAGMADVLAWLGEPTTPTSSPSPRLELVA